MHSHVPCYAICMIRFIARGIIIGARCRLSTVRLIAGAGCLFYLDHNTAGHSFTLDISSPLNHPSSIYTHHFV